MNDVKKEIIVFGIRLKELREEEKGLTQAKLADELHTSKQSIWNYEANHREPNIDMLLAMAKKFNVSIDYLLGNSNFKNTQHEMLCDKYESVVSGEKIIKKLINLPSDTLDFIGTLFSTNSFIEFINTLEQYQSLSQDTVNKFAEFIFKEDEAPKLRALMQPCIAKKELMKFRFDNSITAILDDLDKLGQNDALTDKEV